MLPHRREPRGTNRFSCLFIACCLMGASLLAACDQDILGLTYRKVAGDYALKKGEDGQTFYLVDRTRKDLRDGGVVGADIDQIAWTADYIMVHERAFAAFADGWIIVNIARKEVSGPQKLRTLYKIPGTQRLPIRKVKAAWSELG